MPNGSHVTTPEMYQFNPNGSTTDAAGNEVKTITQATVDADGTTVLNVFFDQVYRVVYKYTDGSAFSYVIDDTGYIYKWNSTFKPPVLNWDVNTGATFKEGWYDNANATGEVWNVWNIAKVIETGTAAFDAATNTLTLYTSADVKVVPQITGQLQVAKLVKDPGNKLKGDEVFKFELKITEIKQSQVLDPISSEEAEKLHHYNSENINAQAANENAQATLNDMVNKFKANALTTASSLSFVMADDEDNALFAVTTGSELT